MLPPLDIGAPNIHRAMPVDVTPVRVFEAHVIGVLDDGFTIRVRTRDSRRNLECQMASPVQNVGKPSDVTQGAGFTGIPEDGSMVLVMTISSGEHYITHCVQPYGGKGYRLRRKSFAPGDVSITSRTGAFLEVTGGGLARVGASNACLTSYNPSDDTVRTICNNLTVLAALGQLEWRVDPDTKRGSFVVLAKSSTADDAPQALLQLGDSASGALAVLATSTGGESSLSIDRVGNVRVDADKSLTLSSKEKVRIEGTGKVYINCEMSSSKKKFFGNNVKLATDSVVPGETPAIAKLPAMASFPTALPAPDTKNPLSSPVPALAPLPLV